LTGIHFVVVLPEDHSYYTFPEHPVAIYSVFRHAWVLIRKKRPDVVVIEGLKMPSTARSDIENAKYCSLFFRPWTLLNGDMLVPHLALLGCGRTVLQQVYEVSRKPVSKTSKGVPTHSAQQHVQWHATWNAYVRGHVVSYTAAELIQSFLLKTLAASGGQQNDDANSEADKSEDDTDLLPLKLSRAGLKQVLAPSSIAADCGDVSGEDGDKKSTGAKLRRGLKRKSLQNEYDRSIRTGCAVWATPESRRSAEDRREPGHMFENKVEEILSSKRASNAQPKSSNAPFDNDRNAAATWATNNADITLDSCMASIMAAVEHPNAEQALFLKHFILRSNVEALEQ